MSKWFDPGRVWKVERKRTPRRKLWLSVGYKKRIGHMYTVYMRKFVHEPWQAFVLRSSKDGTITGVSKDILSGRSCMTLRAARRTIAKLRSTGRLKKYD